jgi:hypothetical protein
LIVRIIFVIVIRKFTLLLCVFLGHSLNLNAADPVLKVSLLIQKSKYSEAVKLHQKSANYPESKLNPYFHLNAALLVLNRSSAPSNHAVGMNHLLEACLVKEKIPVNYPKNTDKQIKYFNKKYPIPMNRFHSLYVEQLQVFIRLIKFNNWPVDTVLNAIQKHPNFQFTPLLNPSQNPEFLKKDFKPNFDRELLAINYLNCIRLQLNKYQIQNPEIPLKSVFPALDSFIRIEMDMGIQSIYKEAFKNALTGGAQSNLIANYYNYCNQLLSEPNNLDPFNQTQFSFEKELKKWTKQALDTLFFWEFNKVIEINQKNQYLTYQKSFSSSPYADSAYKLAENLAFLEAKNSNSEKSYTEFIKSFPKGPHFEKAKYALRYLKVIPVPYLSTSESGPSKYFFVDSASSEIWIDSMYDFAYPFAQPYYKKWLPNGSTLIPGCALVGQNDNFFNMEFHFIEKDGTRMTPNTYEEIIQFHRNYAFINKNDRWGILNSEGKEILPPKFQQIHFDTLQGLGFVYNGQNWAIFSKSGKLNTAFIFSDIHNLLKPEADRRMIRLNENAVQVIQIDSNFIPVLDENGNYSIVNFSGKKSILSTSNFKYIGIVQHNIYWVQPNENQTYFINRNGNVITDTFVEIRQDRFSNHIFYGKLFAQNKKRPTEESWKIIKTHPKLGVRVLNATIAKPSHIMALQNGGLDYFVLYIDEKALDINYHILNSEGQVSNRITLQKKSANAGGKFIYKSNKLALVEITSPNNTKNEKLKKRMPTLTRYHWIHPQTGKISKAFFDQHSSVSILNDSIVFGPVITYAEIQSAWAINTFTKNVCFNINQDKELKFYTVKNKSDTVWQTGWVDFNRFDNPQHILIKNNLGNWGLANSNGRILVEANYQTIEATIYSKFWKVLLPQKNKAADEEQHWGIIDGTGLLKLRPDYEEIIDDEFYNYWLVPYKDKLAWTDWTGHLYAE